MSSSNNPPPVPSPRPPPVSAKSRSGGSGTKSGGGGGNVKTTTKQQYGYDPGSSGDPSSAAAPSSNRPSGGGGGAFYGMLRKTKRKTYTAFRGGRKHPNFGNLAGPNYFNRRGRGGEMDGYSSSDGDDTAPDALDSNGTSSIGAAQAAGQSPFASARRIGGGVAESARNFFVSPQNSWANDGGVPRRSNAGTRNASLGSLFSQRDLQRPQQQQQFPDDHDSMDDIVRTVERCLRQAVLCCAVFIAGSMMPERVSLALRALLELTSVAWGTCVFIVVLDWFQRHQIGRMLPAQHNNNNTTAVASPRSLTPMINNLTENSSRLGRQTTSRPDMFKFSSTDELLSPTEIDFSKKRPHGELVVEPTVQSGEPPSTKIMRGSQEPIAMPKKQQEQKRRNVHPQLDNLYLMMVGKRERIFPNAMACDIDNDLFSGKMLLMIRTPDVDEPMTSSDPVVNYFRGKQRRFEFQWQFRLKKLPLGEVFMGAELEEPIHMGMIQRALSNTALKFVKKTNQGFTYSLSDSSENGSSFLSFPVGTSMDRFNVTKPGDLLPVLGREVVEDAESMKQRKRGTKIEWSTESTYTMALWSAYFDWIDWQILNFPGIRPFSATSVAGVQPIKMTLYTNDSQGADGGKNPKRNVVFSMEVSNAAKSSLGSEAKKWIEDEEAAATSQKRTLDAIVEPLESSDVESNGDETFGEEEDEEDMEEQSETMGDDTSYIEDMEEDDEGIDEGIEVDEFLGSIENSCYLLSGSSVSLREATGNYVASGGGYAVLQSSPTSCIVFEKIQAKKKKGKTGLSPSMMIRNGDVVRVKLVEASSKAVKHLSLHRGWWLRWTSTRPKRNKGLFYIRTAGDPDDILVLGDPFSLVSRRWSQYLIGACIEGSAKYGGRMLGIYKANKNSMDYESIVGGGGGEEDDVGLRETGRMMPLLLCAENFGCLAPLSLSNFSTEDRSSSPVKSPTRANKPKRQTSVEDVDPLMPMLGATGTELLQYRVDVPAWLEVMDRTKRAKQLVYAVRVKETALQDPETEDVDKKQSGVTARNVFVKLRTGSDLAPILRIGVEHKRELSPIWQQRFDFSEADGLNDDESSSSSSDDSDSEGDMDHEPSHFLIAGPNHSDANEPFSSDPGNDYAKVSPDNQDEDAEMQTSPHQLEASPNSGAEQKNNVIEGIDVSTSRRRGSKRQVPKVKREKSIESLNAEEPSSRDNNTSTHSSKPPEITRMNSGASAAPPVDLIVQDPGASNESKKKSRGAVIGRVAKTVKASTVVTGKHVIKHSKNIGKGTVSAGRAAGRVIPVSSVVYIKPPRKHEPGGRVVRKRGTDKGQMKMIGKAIKNIEGQGSFPTSFLSGQLLAPDQSCRKISRILSDISNTPNISAAISALVTKNSAQDLTFLRGSSAELGVKPLKAVDPEFDIDCVVARSLGHSGHWREELCVLYTKGGHLAFYAPLAKKPSLVVCFEEVMSARKCEDESCQSPLPGFHILSIDTAWKCHYLAFLDNAGRDRFLKRLTDAYTKNELPQQSCKVAQEYERYRMSLETSLTGTVGKWRAVSISKNNKQTKQRRILNGRRMEFDLLPVSADKDTGTKDGTQDKVAVYVENLLRMALSFSADALDATDARFIEFLGETSRLRTLPLHQIDLSSKEAICIFVNLYHCLLQHSLLLAVDGLPSKRSVIHFKRCSCYEIGEDVFSLAELECCVIRGKSRTSHIKPPFVSVAKKSRPYRRLYGLGLTDHRINFILNNGDMAYPPAVPVLEPLLMDDQMDAAASRFLNDQVKIDERKKTVFLPKVCDVYGLGDGSVSLSQCLIYLDEVDQLAITSLLNNGVVSVKFNRNCDEFHPSLTELS